MKSKAVMRVVAPGAKELVIMSPRVQRMVAFLVANQRKIGEMEKGSIGFNFASKSISAQFNETRSLE